MYRLSCDMRAVTLVGEGLARVLITEEDEVFSLTSSEVSRRRSLGAGAGVETCGAAEE